MTSSKWAKRNNTVLYTGLAINVLFFCVAGLLFDSLRPGHQNFAELLAESIEQMADRQMADANLSRS